MVIQRFNRGIQTGGKFNGLIERDTGRIRRFNEGGYRRDTVEGDTSMTWLGIQRVLKKTPFPPPPPPSSFEASFDPL